MQGSLPVAEIQRVSVRHEAIMDYLMANPLVRMQDVAGYFKISPGWLSQVIHSDAFQMLLRDKQGTVFHSTVLPLREKMTVVAHAALDKIAEQLPHESDTKTLANVAEAVLDRLGFSSKVPAVQFNQSTNVQVNVLRSEIEEARAVLYQKGGEREVTNEIRGSLEVQNSSLPPVGAESRFAAFQALDAEG